MLNELYDLNASMDEAGIARQSWQKDYKPCPKNRTFFLLISSDGRVSDLEVIKDIGRIQKIRKYEIANGISFPAFNLQPLLHAQSDEAKEAVKRLKKSVKSKNEKRNEQEITSQIDRLWGSCDHVWSSGETVRIEKCLLSAGLDDALRNALKNVPDDHRAIPELMKRSKKLTADELQHGLKRILVQHILRSQDATEWIDSMLVSTAGSVKKVSVVLELADRSSFRYPVNHERSYSWINAGLMEDPVPSNDELIISAVDAFGKPIEEGDGKKTFPAVNLPVIGKVILRAMSSESPCQKRYGQVDANTFPAGSVVRQAMKDALEWLGDKARKGTTWADASGACGFTKRDGKKVSVPGLFLVYPSSLGKDPPELVGLFFREDEALDPDGAKFESAAARVTAALRIMVTEQPDIEVRVFVLTKADKARTKVLVTKKYDAQALISGAIEWHNGCKNIPQIRLNIGTTDRAQWVEPVVPFPAEAIKCLNVAWFQNGQKTELIHGLGIGEGVALLVGSGPMTETILNKAMHLAITNASPLLLALGHADHRRNVPIKLDSRFYAHVNLLPSLLGLLLFKLNFMKGEYMHSPTFLVGRLLALADTLHMEYCRHVRKNETPPQLIGNALMATAKDNPVRGLARLQERLTVYQAWANTVQGENVALAKWALGQMGKISNQLAAVVLPNRADDADKAQMLLGYLARPESKSAELTDDCTVITDGEVPNVK